MVTGSRDHDELHALDYLLRPMPRLNLSESVRADDEEQLSPACLHAFNGVDRVTFGLSFFQPRRHQPSIPGTCQFDHPETMMGLRRLARTDFEGVRAGQFARGAYPVMPMLVRMLAREVDATDS